MLDITTTLTLNNKVEMPVVGYGTWAINTQEMINVGLTAALQSGYRHIDTATYYKNEAFIAEVLKNTDVPRDELFITTKLWPTDFGYDAALRAFDTSQKKLGVDVVDLYLIHWPEPKDSRLDSWRALERLYEEGRVRAIGVSNYAVHHLQELFANANVVPAVNQIELHAYNYQSSRGIIELCRQHDIAITAYSPLAQAKRLSNPTVVAIAEKYNRMPAQILLRWLLQLDVSVIPRSSNPERIRANIDVFDFELSDEDAAKIEALDEGLFLTQDTSKMP